MKSPLERGARRAGCVNASALRDIARIPFVCGLLALLLPLAAPAAQFVHTEGREFVKPDGQILRMRGTNLGNWLVPEGYMWRFEKGPASPHEIEGMVELLLGPEKAAAFWSDYRDRYVTEADIAFLAKAGCNTLRVPLHWKFFTDEKGEGFRLLDRVVTWSRAAGIYLILDLHCAPGGQTGTNIDDSRGYPWLYESPAAQAQLLKVWHHLATHYRDEPVILGYDLLNEPLPAYPGWEKYKPLLEPLFQRVTETVRAADPNHIVILTGAHWDSDFKVLGPPFAKNVAYTFHKYWMPPKLAAVQEYLDFSARHNVPVFIGETGENKDPWIADFHALLEEQHIGWTFWPFKKMTSTAGFLRFNPPVGWDRIVAFAQLATGTDSDRVKAALAVRPTQAEIEATFADLLQQIELARCQPNRGYIEALGLKVP